MTKVAIVGGAKSSQFQAPFEDEAFEIWVLGNQIDQYQGKRVSRIFELHENLSEHPEEYPGFLVNLGIPLTVSKSFPIGGEHVEVYPYDKTNYLGDYFTSSAARLVAYAIYRGVEELGVYGFNMSVDNHEYFKQRSCMEAWLGFAKGKGIKVTVAESSALMKSSYDEGRDWNNGQKSPFTEDAFSRRAEFHQGKSMEYRMLMNTHDGCRQTYEVLAKMARANDMGHVVNFEDITNE